MAGKYAKLKGKLEKFQVDPSWQEKIDEAKKEYVGLDTAEMAREFGMHRRVKQNLEAQIKLENTHLEALNQLLVGDLDGSELQKITLTTGETGYIQDEPYSSIEDREALMAWTKKKKLLKMLTWHWQTLNGMVKEFLIDGKPLPPGVKCYLKTSFRLRGGAKDEEEAA